MGWLVLRNLRRISNLSVMHIATWKQELPNPRNWSGPVVNTNILLYESPESGSKSLSVIFGYKKSFNELGRKRESPLLYDKWHAWSLFKAICSGVILRHVWPWHLISSMSYKQCKPSIIHKCFVFTMRTTLLRYEMLWSHFKTKQFSQKTLSFEVYLLVSEDRGHMQCLQYLKFRWYFTVCLQITVGLEWVKMRCLPYINFICQGRLCFANTTF